MKENLKTDSVSPGGIPEKMRCSIGVMAHNEEKNIGCLLERLTAQHLEKVSISEVIVVASGCDDSTEDIVIKFQKKQINVRLVCEPVRKGKASAVNIFLKESKEDYLLLVGADTLPDNYSVERLIIPLSATDTGMVGARPVPLNNKTDFPGYVVHFLWELHHQLALIRPKCGEMVAFRRVFSSLPEDTIVDEPQIEAIVMKAGLKVVYEPSAIVYNLGPSNISEIIMRRRSIVSGYVKLSEKTDYRVTTQQLRWWLIKYVFSRIISGKEPFFKAAGAIAVEIIARTLGGFDARLSRKKLHIWRHAPSTKAPAEFKSAEIPE